MSTMDPKQGNRLLLLQCVACLLCVLPFASAYVQFEPLLVPKSEASKKGVRSTYKVTYGSFLKEDFEKIARTTEDHNCILPGCQRMGEVLDIQRNNVTNFDRETLGAAGSNATKVDFSHYPSGGVLIQEENIGRWFMLYQFEKPNPGNIYRMRMRLENDTDLASRLNVPINSAPLGGLWKPRVAIVTPSNTMMGSEGIPPDGKLFEVAKCMDDPKRFDCLKDWDSEGFIDIVEFMRYFGRSPGALKKEGKLLLEPKEAIPGFKPYRYGFPYEISLTLNEDDRVIDEIAKRYALGRLGAQGIAVMQDGFTIYLSGGKGGLFKFVSDPDSRDFSSGELSAAIIRVKGEAEFTEIEFGTEFSIDWISIGKTDAEEFSEFVAPNSALVFSDIFEHSEPEGGVCGSTFKLVTIGGVEECLRVKDSALAAVFEPERAGAVLDATLGVFKFSEMATRLDSDRFYLGAREILSGPLGIVTKSGGGDIPTADIAENMCGCVFEVLFDEQSFSAESMRAISCGSPAKSSAENSDEEEDEANKCSTEGIANPRALSYVNVFEYLLIGEDSEFHENNYIWAWDPETERSTRIFHAPLQGSITSVAWFQDVVGGNNYIGTTISKPLDTFGWLSYFGSFDLRTGEKMTFSGVPVPYARGPKRLPIPFKRVTIGESEKIDGFVEVFRTGKEYKRAGRKSEIVLGQVVDRAFTPVKSYKDGAIVPAVVDQPEIHHRLGFVSMIDMCGTVFSVSSTDSIPGMSYVMKLEENAKGHLQTVNVDYIDWSQWGGLWRAGGDGVVSPWNSHIGGEIFEPDSLDFLGFPCLTGSSSCFKSRDDNAFDSSMMFIRYFDTYFNDLDNKFQKLTEIFNIYNYGYAFEVEVDKSGCTSASKLMTLGRFSHGDISIMPDGKTVYMVDTTTGRDSGGGLFRFIAKNKNDLTSGTLYAAKMKPVFGTLEKFTMSWIELGSATNSELVTRSKTVKFYDLFDYIPEDKNCRLDTINVKSKKECIAVKEGSTKWAAFFETRRYAALAKATIEFANVKGLTYDRNTDKLFLSLSRITKRDRIMLQDDIEGSSNNIKVSSAECGVLFELPLVESDDTDYDTEEFTMAYKGTNLFGTFGDNACSVEDPANPSSMSSIPGHNQFLIGEDACELKGLGLEVVCGHENGAVWAMDPFLQKGKRGESRERTRLATTPPFTSISSLNWYPKINEASYITFGVNELYHDGFDNLVNPKTEDQGAFFGYLGPFKSEEADKRRPEIKAQPLVCNGAKPSKGGRFQCPKT